MRPPVILVSLAGAALVLGVAAAVEAPGRATAPRLVVNESASLPRGLYRRTADLPRRGDIVAVRPPPVARAYLATLNAPPSLRLLKRATAVAGDQVCAGPEGLRWPGGRLAPAAAHDRRGVALPEWRGCRALADDEILVLGDTGASFDSRYFGPVRLAAVAGVYAEVLRW